MRNLAAGIISALMPALAIAPSSADEWEAAGPKLALSTSPLKALFAGPFMFTPPYLVEASASPSFEQPADAIAASGGHH